VGNFHRGPRVPRTAAPALRALSSPRSASGAPAPGGATACIAIALEADVAELERVEVLPDALDPNPHGLGELLDRDPGVLLDQL
jgi:hypothetical protein